MNEHQMMGGWDQISLSLSLYDCNQMRFENLTLSAWVSERSINFLRSYFGKTRPGYITSIFIFMYM